MKYVIFTYDIRMIGCSLSGMRRLAQGATGINNPPDDGLRHRPKRPMGVAGAMTP